MSTTTTTSSVAFPTSTKANLRADLTPLRIPDLDTLEQDMDKASTSPVAVPFPRISQRRKLYRGVGTQPWHKRTPSDSDSEEEVLQLKPKAKVATVLPSPELMPGADPKRTYSESQIQGSGPVTPMLTVYTTPLIRKKSGEVVKSSLKSPSVSSFGSSRPSRPPTPIFEKSVHFDGQLEHVKIFFKEQKPAAVSREGSPYGSETSDNDTVGHSYTSEEERLRSKLVLETVNIPLRNAMASTQERLGDLDVRLEQVKLSQDGRNVEGTVLVRNIAFEKWVSVRFTYDFWQTTSEVSAKYASSFPEENTDLFSFSIRLPDVTRKIEDKRLFFALRYNVAEKEAWDNNKGDNYQIRFKVESKSPKQRQPKVVSPSPSSSSSKFPPSWPVKTANVDQMADLRRELERVVREDEESSGLQDWDVLTAKLRAKNIRVEEDLDAEKTLNLKKRYDFGASSKIKWEPPKELPKYGGPPPETANIPFPSRHVKSASHSGVTSPLQQLNNGSWRSPRGSPRDHGTDSTPHSPKFFIDPKDAKHWGGSTPQQQQQQQQSSRNTRQRNHQRGGYFDSWLENSKCVLTPTTPVKEEQEQLQQLQQDTSAIDMSASSSIDSVATITPSHAEAASVVALSPSVVVNDVESVEVSESESTDSTTSSSSPDSTAIGLGVEQARAIRFNSYPMDRTYIAAATAGSSPEAVSPAAVPAGAATLTVPQPWSAALSPQGSLSSVSSTPSFTSASSPSQCPSSPSELSDSLKAINQPGANKLDSLDYGYFLSKFCYFTGHDIEDRHNVNNSYGSTFHRHSLSDSTMDGGHSANYPSKRPAFISRISEESASWSGESGHTTPRANSPVVNDVNELEATPRISESFVRPHRGSL